jgi:hypothetical protein
MPPRGEVWKILARMCNGVSDEEEKEEKYDENKTQRKKCKSNR